VIGGAALIGYEVLLARRKRVAILVKPAE